MKSVGYSLVTKQVLINKQSDKYGNLMREALKLWVAIRMENRSERIRGSETLEMEPQTWDPKCNNYGHIPLPPVMSAQIDIIMTKKILMPLKRKVVQQLQDLIEENKTKSWFVIYLVLFILLHSCAMTTDFALKQGRKKGVKVRPLT